LRCGREGPITLRNEEYEFSIILRNSKVFAWLNIPAYEASDCARASLASLPLKASTAFCSSRRNILLRVELRMPRWCGRSTYPMLRIFIRLASDTKTIDKKLYLSLQEQIDEIGRMLGGWLKSLK
jgi:hypothetical protein